MVGWSWGWGLQWTAPVLGGMRQKLENIDYVWGRGYRCLSMSMVGLGVLAWGRGIASKARGAQLVTH